MGGIVRQWPTPTSQVWGGDAEAHLARKRKAIEAGSSMGLVVSEFNALVSVWPTAGATDWKGSSRPGQRRGQLSEAAETSPSPGPPDPPNSTDGPPSRRMLNPLFVEWLMGFPPGWTVCGASETPSCQPKQNSPSESYPGGSDD